MTAAISAYRSLLRSINCAFAGDGRAWTQARIRVRQEFESKRQLDDPETVKKQLRTAQQVAHILKHNIVQAHLRPNDKVFEVKLDASRHELGENDSRFSKKSSTPAAVGKCCGSA